MYQKKEDSDVEKETKQEIKPKLYFDRLKIRCPRCWHTTAIRHHSIQNIKDATYICENCGKPIKK